ncbi:hypothetical protein ACFL5N_00630 [bacterium]
MPGFNNQTGFVPPPPPASKRKRKDGKDEEKIAKKPISRRRRKINKQGQEEIDIKAGKRKREDKYDFEDRVFKKRKIEKRKTLKRKREDKYDFEDHVSKKRKKTFEIKLKIENRNFIIKTEEEDLAKKINLLKEYNKEELIYSLLLYERLKQDFKLKDKNINDILKHQKVFKDYQKFKKFEKKSIEEGRKFLEEEKYRVFKALKKITKRTIKKLVKNFMYGNYRDYFVKGLEINQVESLRSSV